MINLVDLDRKGSCSWEAWSKQKLVHSSIEQARIFFVNDPKSGGFFLILRALFVPQAGSELKTGCLQQGLTSAHVGSSKRQKKIEAIFSCLEKCTKLHLNIVF